MSPRRTLAAGEALSIVDYCPERTIAAATVYKKIPRPCNNLTLTGGRSGFEEPLA
jgi:hypothetical protein